MGDAASVPPRRSDEFSWWAVAAVIAVLAAVIVGARFLPDNNAPTVDGRARQQACIEAAAERLMATDGVVGALADAGEVETLAADGYRVVGQVRATSGSATSAPRSYVCTILPGGAPAVVIAAPESGG